MKITKINVVPDVRLLADIGAANYSIPQAINELVANSMDARYENERLTIDVTINENFISVVDDGCGMNGEVLGEAMRLSAQMDHITGNTKPRKGMYGLGMKAACASLGKDWRIVSRPIQNTEEYSVHVNLTDWVAKKDRGAWEIEVVEESREPRSILGSKEHGTAVQVMSLASKEFTFSGAVIEGLAMAYRPHLEAGDVIKVNGVSVAPSAYDLVDGRKWDIDLDVGDFKVKGWVGLDKKTHNKGDYGLNIYRLNQLVSPWNKDFFRNHLMTSRIVGEIHLDFVNATFHKLGFHKNSEEWRMVESTLREFLKPVVRASEAMSKNRNDTLRRQKAIEDLDRALGVVRPGPPLPLDGENGASFVPSATELTGTHGYTSGKEPSTNQNSVFGSLDSLGMGDEEFTLSYALAELTDDGIPWDYIYDPSSNELQAIINTHSRVYEKIEDQKFLAALALAEAVIGFLINQRGVSYDNARDVRDKWLAAVLEA